MTHHAKPLPRITPDNEPFWQACRRHELALPHCQDCARAFLPPAPVCPFCFGDSIEWRKATGRGVISTWTVVHKAWFDAFAPEVPYNVVQVELEDERLVAAGQIQGIRLGQVAEGGREAVAAMLARRAAEQA